MFDNCPVCLHCMLSPAKGGLCLCRVCGHVFQNPPETTAVYGEQYVADRYDKYPANEAMSWLRLGALATLRRQGRLLDVGYGNGSFLRAAAKVSTFDCWGCDVVRNGEKYGVRDAEPGQFDQWDVVTFFDSLEHVPDLNWVRQLAVRTEVILVSTPARPDWFPESLDWKHYRPGEHLHYFSIHSLDKLFSGHRRIWHLDMEDAIRGRLPGGEWNIMTATYKRH